MLCLIFSGYSFMAEKDEPDGGFEPMTELVVGAL